VAIGIGTDGGIRPEDRIADLQCDRQVVLGVARGVFEVDEELPTAPGQLGQARESERLRLFRMDRPAPQRPRFRVVGAEDAGIRSSAIGPLTGCERSSAVRSSSA